ncbi:hypothetical protein TNIN_410361 [Trichonephila inaurata madagascariensis]|uniref:Uncharacterized protein n=1 Tax=Trichonephila inaurata madagascariensis TaxID=2747483 RepID=A0A8X6JYL9_9ARAC|nr:hypothetical protein TNIN_410361 [Trichonephila inaurata madagascariensis]
MLLCRLTVLERGKGFKLKAREIIDSGSQRSYILTTTAEKMKHSSKRREYLQYALFDVPIRRSANMMCSPYICPAYRSELSRGYGKIVDEKLLYVDNCVTSVPSEEELNLLIKVETSIYG